MNGQNRREFLKVSSLAGMESLFLPAFADSVQVPLSNRINRAREEAQRQIDAGLILGAVFAIGNQGPAVALGRQCKTPHRLMSVRSKFELASAAKTFTSAACSLLANEGRLDLDAPFTEYLPEHVLAKENCDITVRDLAMHVGGFDNSKPYQNPDMDIYFRKLYAKRPVRKRLEKYEYACSNFLYLGMIVERISGKRLDTFCRERIWEPLGMKETTWDPIPDDGHVVQFWNPLRPIGAQNDLTSFYCPFPTGNGSAYSTITDIRLFLTDLLERKHFPQAYYDLLFTCRYEKNGVRRSFGWDMGDAYRPKNLSKQAIFHSGWTGQTICVDPGTGFCGAVLTSRLGDWTEAILGRKRILELLRG